MANYLAARSHTLDVLRRELVGPDPQGDEIDVSDRISVNEATAWMPRRQAGTGQEILTRDAPNRRYGIGVLYSSGARQVATQVPTGDGPVEQTSEAEGSLGIASATFTKEITDAQNNIGEEATSNDLDLTGANDYRPTTMAVSFLADLPPGSRLELILTAGRYQERDIHAGTKTRSWWFRSSCSLKATWDGAALISATGRHFATVECDGLDGMAIEAFAVSRPRDGNRSLLTIGVMNIGSGSSPNHFLFQVGFEVNLSRGPGRILAYPEPTRTMRDAEEESIDLLYRDVPTFAIGHGCAAGWETDGKSGKCLRVMGEALPVVDTPSITPQVFRSDGTEVRVPMAPLAGLIPGQDGISSLIEVVALYRNWILEQETRLPGLDARHHATAIRHLGSCRTLANRMQEGLDLIRSDKLVADAFRLANHAVLLQQIHSTGGTRRLIYDERLKLVRHAEPRKSTDPLTPPPGRGTWRPFQIAFLLASIASTADAGHADRLLVDLIFFPTGGGKTEAYLGLSAFSMFLRRLSNPLDAGVEVLMRYTLRLLTAQQFQRAAALVCAMEVLRHSDDRLGKARFSIGIWVGGDTSPNSRESALTSLRSLHRSQQGAANPFLVIRCPWCAAQIGPLSEPGKRSRSKGPRLLGYEEVSGSVQISCTDTTCEFSGGLPLYVIDEDIYAYRPSIVIGTVNKFAQLAWRAEARAIFGIGLDGNHDVSPPGLIIQDELHLISGPLGSMVGLYESVIEELCTTGRLGEHPRARPKIISSTATIRRYADQVRALFAREAVSLFPPHGLDAGNSFFARYATYPPGHESAGKAREGRLYVGIHGGGLGSVQTSQVRTFSALLQAGKDLPEIERDPYWTLMVFFNSLRELGTSLSLLQWDIPNYMQIIGTRRGSAWDEVRRLNRELELTGRLKNDEVPLVMEALETPYSPSRDTVNVCLASNIIEVGIDIDRLSLMVVVGQPKTTSQYIQVTGRVGRNWQERPGLIATIYSPSKPRDRSHYEKFRTYHQRLYAQVEPTSVTPFAPPVLSRALHAVLVAWVRQRLGQDSVGSPYPVPDVELAEAAAVLRERVRCVDPEEVDAVERFLAQRLEEWGRWLPGDWRRHGNAAEPGLLYPAGDYADPEERIRSWATPTSLRNVDAECRVSSLASMPSLRHPRASREGARDVDSTRATSLAVRRRRDGDWAGRHIRNDRRSGCVVHKGGRGGRLSQPRFHRIPARRVAAREVSQGPGVPVAARLPPGPYASERLSSKHVAHRADGTLPANPLLPQWKLPADHENTAAREGKEAVPALQ